MEIKKYYIDEHGFLAKAKNNYHYEGLAKRGVELFTETEARRLGLLKDKKEEPVVQQEPVVEEPVEVKKPKRKITIK